MFRSLGAEIHVTISGQHELWDAILWRVFLNQNVQLCAWSCSEMPTFKPPNSAPCFLFGLGRRCWISRFGIPYCREDVLEDVCMLKTKAFWHVQVCKRTMANVKAASALHHPHHPSLQILLLHMCAWRCVKEDVCMIGIVVVSNLVTEGKEGTIEHPLCRFCPRCYSSTKNRTPPLSPPH